MDCLTICAATIVTLFTLLYMVYRKFRFHPQNEIMAFSSSTASSSPSSSSPYWKHDVFPSFHGEDSGRSFLSHILMEFRRKGIELYIDQKSKSVDSNLTQAIRGSRIAIVVISRNYASSSWYLNELVEIMKCREELGQVVVPIFYKLDPIDVKTQSGDFGEVFKKTCAGKTKENIGIWSEALGKISTIAGYHSSNWDKEGATIENIATDISNILKNSTPSSDLERIISNRLLHTVYIYCADTLQYSFASHLSMDFRRKGISAFVNCNETLEVIEGANAFVVVFSKSCFSSTSYLENLVRVLQCRKENVQLLVPVFYGVSPSDVLVPEQESADWITEWSSKIQELRELPGHQYREECSECELVEEIVKDVSEKLFPTEQIGINSRLLAIERLLCNQPWGIRRIGIWGMPGIGKTTLAKTFFDQISGGYEASCFINQFDKAFHEKGFHRLLGENFGKILKELPRVCSSITRPSLPRDKVKKKRTLLVLDDVHNPLVAESFLGGFHWFGPGSLIIIISQDKQVFRLCQIDHVYEVQSLNEDEALQLFSQRALVKDTREKNLLKLSKKVIDYANGNPLAINFYGGELKGKALSEMNTTFLKFKLCFPYELHNLFKSSYETLDDNEKNIFLDIACFFNGDNVVYVMPLLEGCGFFPHVGIDVLVDKCLVTISESRVKMHRLIQDFGREIINGETVHIERRRRLWEPCTIKFLLEDDATCQRALGTEDIEGIFLDTTDLLFDVKPTAFENMLNLRFLKISSSTFESHYGLRLPKGLDSLPYELRLLHWENYPLQSLPQDFDPCHLVELNMSYSQLQKLWGGTMNLEMLKTVKLCHSEQLTEIDDICKAQNIEVIDLQGCTELERFPATGQLQHLRVVNLTGCIEISSFPEISTSIEELHLGGTSIRYLPISIGNATNLKELYLTRCSSLMELPACIGNATNLEKLHLARCSSLVKLPSTLGNVTNLKELYLSRCSSLVELPTSIGNATNLEILDLRLCQSLVELPSSIGNATNLRTLNLEYCSKLVELPASSFTNAINLKELYLEYCSKLVELPASIGNASNLEILDLNCCSSLVELPDSIGNATNLRNLDLSNCSSLTKLPSTFGNASNLKELCLIRCLSLVELPTSIGNATNLQKLNLMYCSKLVKLPLTLWNVTKLKELYLTGCSSLVELPASIENASNLEILDLSCCSSLVELPSSIGNVTNLRKLNLEHCSKLVELPSSFSNAINLKELSLTGCSSLLELPSFFRGFVRGSAWPSTLHDSSKDLDRNLKEVITTSSSSHNQKWDNEILADVHLVKGNSDVRFNTVDMTLDNMSAQLGSMKNEGGGLIMEAMKRTEARMETETKDDLENLGVGLELGKRKVKKMMFEAEGGLFGISGMAGVGKTTLARELERDDEVRCHFKNRILFLTVSQSPILDKLRAHIWNFLSGHEGLNPVPNWNFQFEGGIKTRNLVILDDVWTREALDRLTFSGCTTLVVSRSKLTDPKTTYDVEVLREDEAISLFCQKSVPSAFSKDLVKQVVDERKGLPLAIKVTAASLKDRPERYWEDASQRLSIDEPVDETDETRLFHKMEASLEDLDPKTRECFLDLGAFPEDRKIPLDILINMWIEVHDLTEGDAFAVLIDLADKNLLTLAKDPRIGSLYTSYHDIFVTQHAFLRDLALHLCNRGKVNRRQRLLMPKREVVLPREWEKNNDEPYSAQIVSIHTGKCYLTFKDGDLRVNKDGVRIVSQSEPEVLSPIKPADDQLSLSDLDMVKVIGKGSIGVVQLVQHKWTGQFFALKVIQLKIDEATRKAIVQELKINQSTQCPNLVTSYQSFYDNGAISLILEYMDGGSLADFLKSVKAIPESYLSAILKQVLQGLLYLHHNRHIIHRDLKPSNLLINHRGEVKITDFGVSTVMANTAGLANTFVGTYKYMSPERIVGNMYGNKSDIWSLGLVVLECATGKFPYLPPGEEETWKSVFELMEAIVDQPPPSLPSGNFSPELSSFISACLQKDPNSRSSAKELMEHPFLNKYNKSEINLASYFTDAGSPLATLGYFSGEMNESEWFDMEFPKAEVLILNFSSDKYVHPPFISKMSRLRFLVIINNGMSPTVLQDFSVFANLSKLKSLWLERVHVPELSNATVPLKNLQKMSLITCKINNSFGQTGVNLADMFPKLSDLTIDHCDDLVELPTSICEMTSLDSLTVTNCSRLRSLPKKLSNLQALEILRLYACPELNALPVEICELPRLKYLDISQCVSLDCLPEEIGKLTTLEKIDMSDCCFSGIPTSAVSLVSLRVVICDEDIAFMWEEVKKTVPGLRIEAVEQQCVSLDWLDE